MILSQDAATQMLLACLANPDGDHAGRLAALTDAEQHGLLQLAQRSRCVPLLHHVISRSGVELTIARQLAEEARDQVLTSLAQARGLARVMRILREAGLEPIALKGVALAWRDYPAPQLRVLRDVDLLLPAERAEDAHRLLLSLDGYRLAPWAGQYGAEYGHQLPEIVDQSHGLVIEIHHRLNARGWSGDSRLTQMVRDDAQVLELLGVPVRIPVPHANLLHLVEHATLHHAFANGPAILADLHYLVRANRIDWNALIADARELQLLRSLQLLASLAQRLGAQWVPQALLQSVTISDDMKADAIRAMFAEEETHRQYAQLWRLAGRSGGKTGPAQAVTRMFQPNRYQLARLSGHPPHSILRWLGYPRWLLEKGIRFLRARRTGPDGSGYAGYAVMRGWLEGIELLGKDTPD